MRYDLRQSAYQHKRRKTRHAEIIVYPLREVFESRESRFASVNSLLFLVSPSGFEPETL